MRARSTSEGRERLNGKPNDAPNQEERTPPQENKTVSDTSESDSSTDSDEDIEVCSSQSTEAVQEDEGLEGEQLRGQFATVVDVLQDLGLESLEATTAAQRMCSIKHLLGSIYPVYSSRYSFVKLWYSYFAATLPPSSMWKVS